MRHLFHPYLPIDRPRFTSQIFIPLMIVLTIIGLVNSLQAFSVSNGKHTIAILGKHFASQTLFAWYYVFVAFLIQTLSTKIHLTRETALRWYSIHLVMLVLSGLFHITLTMGIERLIWGNIPRLTFYRLLLNSPSVWLDIAVYIFFLLGFSMIEHQRINHENEVRYSQLEVQLLKSQLREIRSTMYPQFLFNTLQSIADLLDQNRNKDANNVLTRLSGFLRTTVYDTERDEIPLEEELQPLRQYIEIEKMRFPGSFTLVEKNEENIREALVPNFILQPIVENFIERALKQRRTPYEIILAITRTSDQLILRISDNDCQRENDRQVVLPDDVLISITKGRLAHLYGNEHAFTVAQNESGGMKVQIVIPFHTQERTVESPLLETQAI